MTACLQSLSTQMEPAMRTEGCRLPTRASHQPTTLHMSRRCGYYRLLSRQCRSCVAISSYIWLLGLRQLCLLPGQAYAFHSLAGGTSQSSDWLQCQGGSIL
ncbi:uncharacterized protein V6R79_023640 [Siganus canaliculatus]